MNKTDGKYSKEFLCALKETLITAICTTGNGCDKCPYNAEDKMHCTRDYEVGAEAILKYSEALGELLAELDEAVNK